MYGTPSTRQKDAKLPNARTGTFHDRRQGTTPPLSLTYAQLNRFIRPQLEGFHRPQRSQCSQEAVGQLLPS